MDHERPALPGGGIQLLARRFNPEDFDADRDSLRLAKAAGMRYIVFTAKHHEGFAMFRSKASGTTPRTPRPGGATRRGAARACDRHGLKLCFYYSQAQDCTTPDGIQEGVPGGAKDFRRYLDENASRRSRSS